MSLSHFIPQVKKRVFSAVIDWWAILLGLTVSQGANALVFIIIANKVPPTEYGQYSAIHGLIILSLALPNAGLDTFLLSYNLVGGPSIYSVWKRAFSIRLGLLAIWFVVLRIGAIFLSPATFPTDLMVFVYLGLASDALIQICYSAMRNLGRYKEVAILQTFIALVLIIMAFSWPSGSGQVLRFSATRFIVSAAFASFVFTRMYSIKPVHVISGQGNINRSIGIDKSSWARMTLPFLLADVATSVYLRADLTIVSLFQGAYGASIYGAALNIVNLLFLIPNALYLFVLPKLAKQYQLDQCVFLKSSSLQLRLQFLIGIALTIVVLVWSPLLVKLLLPAYANAIPILHLMTPIMVLKALNFGTAAILTSSQLQSWRVTAQIISALFNVTANLVVIGSFGIRGVALVYVLSEFLLLVGYTWSVYNHFYRYHR